MAVKDEFNPGVGLAFGEVEFCQFFHAPDEGFAGGNGAEGVRIRLALHGAGVGVHRRQQQKRKNRGDQREQRKVGEVRRAVKSEMWSQPIQRAVNQIEAGNCGGALNRDHLKNVAMNVVAQFVRQHRLNLLILKLGQQRV